MVTLSRGSRIDCVDAPEQRSAAPVTARGAYFRVGRHMILLSWIGSVFAVLVAGCDSPTGPDALHPADARPYVVGAALANLDAHGRFQFSDPAALDLGEGVSPERARELASAAVRDFVNSNTIPIPGATSFKEFIEARHGAPIDWERVRAGPRLFNIESHLEPLPQSVFLPLRRQFGLRYAVPFLVDDVQVAVVTVSALATNLTIENGRLRRDPTAFGGGEFSWHGAPRTWKLGVPVFPEEVVRFVFEATGAKVREVPVAARVSRLFSTGSNSRWIVVLDHSVEFVAAHNGAVLMTDTVHVAQGIVGLIDPIFSTPQLRMYLPTPDQPTLEEFPRVPQFDGSGNRTEDLTMYFPIKPTRPTDLMLVGVAR